MNKSKLNIELKQTAGSVPPAYYYEESITVRGDRVELNRTGGETVNAGKWDIELNESMCEKINTLIDNIDSVTDADDVSEIIPIGGGCIHLTIYRNNIAEQYYQAYIREGDKGVYHSLKSDVKLLVDYINEIILKIPIMKPTYNNLP